MDRRILEMPNISTIADSDVVPIVDVSEVEDELKNKSVTVGQLVGNKANLDSPFFTGSPQAPTPIARDNTSKIATTAFVNTAVSLESPTYLNRSNHTGTQLSSSISDFNQQVTNIINSSLSTYDTTNDGVVDNSEKLEGQFGSYYLNRSNHTGTQTVNSLSDFNQGVVNLLQAGNNITLNYDSQNNKLEVNSISDTSSLVTIASNQTITGVKRFSSGEIILDNTTSNKISWGSVGLNPPTNESRSSGTKLILYPTISQNTVDYAIGIENNSLWQSIKNTDATTSFKWYGNTTELMKLQGDGKLIVSGDLDVKGTILGLNKRQQLNYVTGTLAPNQAELFDLLLGKTYLILKISADGPAWIRGYSKTEYRAADSTRQPQDRAVGEHGVMFEAITTGTNPTVDFNPIAIGSNLENTAVSDTAVSIVNLGITSQVFNIVFVKITLEE